jgi:hypothetical protein
MGEFCAATGYTPGEFWEMTNEEVEAISRGLRKQNG